MDGTVVVTGASRGIGAAVTRRFADEGAHVVACARSVEDLDEVADDASDADGSVATLRADVRDEFDAERLMERAAREGARKKPSDGASGGAASRVGGAIDVVVAAAGVYHGEPGETPISEESYSAFDDAVRINGRGVFTTIREAIPHLAADARVLVPSGRVAREATPGFGGYAASKALAEAVVQQFAADVDRTVGVVDPGQVATDLSGAGGREPAEVADLFLWAATEAPASDLDGGVLDVDAWARARS
jgi:NAD(P)-dependent dehydrogenase (short-subunit alcohol dehydrogenase family)